MTTIDPKTALMPQERLWSLLGEERSFRPAAVGGRGACRLAAQGQGAAETQGTHSQGQVQRDGARGMSNTRAEWFWTWRTERKTCFKTLGIC
jgi:hypothetical protein